MRRWNSKSKLISRGRFSLHLFLNASGYYNAGVHIYHRNNGAKFRVDVLICSVSIMYVGSRSEPWLKRISVQTADT